MFPKNPNTSRRNIPTWICLLLVVVGALVLLTACGRDAAASANTTTVANTPAAAQPTPTPTVAQPTPTPTIAQSTPVAGSKQTILITDGSNGSFGFSPTTLTIKVGTTITWKNMSSAPHTVSTDDGQTADSGTVAVGGTFQFTFKTSGSFPYHCNYHPYMRATVIVV